MENELAVFLYEQLSKVTLPPLSRPPVPPDADPTEELVFWGIRKYAYSTIAHVRTIIRGIILLHENGNEPSLIILCRHVYEWTMQSSYVRREFGEMLNRADLKESWNLFLALCEGNSWIQKHGAKYVPELPVHETEESIHLREFKKAFKEDQKNIYGTDTVDDDYGYLCEHSHPNGVCLQTYLAVNPPVVSFVEPPKPPRIPGILVACSLQWLLSMVGLLTLAKENPVRCELVKLLKHVAQLPNT